MNVDASMINMISNIVFYVVIGIIVIKSLVGLGKGFWKGICSLIITGLCYFLVIYFNPNITNWVYNLNISNLNLVINLENMEPIAVSSVGQAVRDLIIAYSGETVDIAGNTQLFNAVDALSKSIVALGVFIIDIILVVLIIAPIFSWIIYHLLFKHIIGKRLRTKHKVRVLGFLTYGTKALVTCALLLTPFSALVQSVSTASENYDLTLNDTSVQVKEYVDAYNDSYLAKAISAVKINGNSYDIYFTDIATSFLLDGGDSTSLISELSLALNLTLSAIEQGAYDLNSNTVYAMKLLSQQFVSNALQTISNSKLITNLLPVLLSIACNMDKIKNVADLSNIDWGQLDWSNELSTIDDLYSQMYELKIFQKVINQEDFQSYCLNREESTKIENIFKKLNESEALSLIVPNLLCSMANKLEGEFAGILPTNLEAYEHIDLASELCTLYEVALNISDLAVYSDLNRNLMISDLSNENFQTVLNFVLSKDAIQGYRENPETAEKTYFYTTDTLSDTEKEPLPLSTKSLFYGIEKVEAPVEGLKKEATTTTEYNGLLDSSLIIDNMSGLLKAAIKMGGFGEEYNFDDAINEVTAEVTDKEGWKVEVDSLLNIFSVVYNNENLPLDSFDIGNSTQVNELKKITPYIDQSKLVTKMIPPLVTNLLSGKEIVFGLTTDDLNFNVDHLGTEINKLLDIALNANDIMDSLSGENAIDNMLDSTKLNIDTIETLLEDIYSSNIINPKKAEGEMSNFGVILQGLFGQDSFKEMGIDVPESLFKKIDGEDFAYEGETGFAPWMVEAKNICNSFRTLQSSTSMKAIILGETSSISTLEGQEVENLLTDLAESRLIEPTIGTVLNKYLSSSLESMNLNIDFENVTDWNKEGVSLNKVISTLKKMDSKSFSLENIDITKLNYDNADGTTGIDDLENLLESVYKLQSLQNKLSADGTIIQSNEVFGNFVYSNVTSKVLGEYITASNENDIKEDHLFEINDEVYTSTGAETKYIAWERISDDESTEYNGEIDNICNLLRYVYNTKDADGKLVFFTYDADNNPTEINIEGAISSGTDYLDGLVKSINKIYPFRTVLSSLIDDQIKNNQSMEIGGIDFSKANSSIFEKEYNYKAESDGSFTVPTDRKAEIELRQNELTSLMDIFDSVKNVSEQTTGSDINLASFNTCMTDVRNLLNSLYDSNIFNENKAESTSDTTVFEDVIKYILDKSTLSEMIYDSNYDVAYESSDAKVKALIKNVTLNNVEGIEWVNTSSTGQIKALCDLIEAATNLKEDDGVTPVESFSSVDSLPQSAVKTMLDKLNECYLTHDAVGKSINQILTTTGFDQYILDDTKANAPLNGHYIDTLDLTYDEKVQLWKEDIVYFTNLYGKTREGIDSLTARGEDGKLQSAIFEDTIPNIGKLNTFENQRADIIYSIFAKGELDTYIEKYGSYTTDAEGSRNLIKHLIDTKIVVTDKETTNSNWDYEGKQLDVLANTLIANENKNLDGSDGKEKISGSDGSAIIKTTYTYTANAELTGTDYHTYETCYERSYLTSELVSSFLEQNIDNIIGEERNTYDFRKDDYSYVGLNEIEASGFEGLLDYVIALEEYKAAFEATSTTVATFDYNFWSSSALISVAKMGNKEASEETIAYVGSDNYGNSLLATLLFNSLTEDNRTSIENISTAALAALPYYNLNYDPDFESQDVIIDWTINKSFEEKGEEWLITDATHKAPFESICIINKAVRS